MNHDNTLNNQPVNVMRHIQHFSENTCTMSISFVSSLKRQHFRQNTCTMSILFVSSLK